MSVGPDEQSSYDVGYWLLEVWTAAGSEIVGMGAEQLNLQIDAKLMRSLEFEAKRQHRSASHLAGEAIEVMLRNCAEKRAAIRAALEEAEAGAFVSEKAMNDWVSSWGTDAETPPPEPDVFRGSRDR